MLKKAKIAFLLVMALVFALQGAGMETALAAKEVWEKEEVTLSNILSYMGNAVSYGVVAHDYTQLTHSEANIFVDNLFYKGIPPILASSSTKISNSTAAVVAKVTLPELHFADSMTFGLYTLEGNTYIPMGVERTVNVAGKTEVDLDFGVVTNPNYVSKDIYVLQVENNIPVQNSDENSDDMTVTYGPPVTSRSSSVVYIGSIDEDTISENMLRLFQDDEGDLQGVYNGLDLGEDLRLYRKTGDSYSLLPDDKGVADRVYIRDKEWTVGKYYELGDLSFDGTDFWVYKGVDGEHKITINYLNSKTQAQNLLEQLSDLSYNLANSNLTIGGTAKSLGSIPSVLGNSSVTSPIGQDGTVISLYAMETQRDTEKENTIVLDRTSIYPENEDSTQTSLLDGKGLPLANNEYAVINVVVSAPTADQLDENGKDKRELILHGAGLRLVNSDGSMDKADKDNWKEGKATNYGRVIWNPVYQDANGKYQPFNGTVIAGQQHGGTVLAPEAEIIAYTTSEATTLVAQKVTCHDEVHQNSFQATSTFVRMAINAEHVTRVFGTKVWTNPAKAEDTITVTLNAKTYDMTAAEPIEIRDFTKGDDGVWDWSFENLPKYTYDENGEKHLIEYSITEKGVYHHNVSVSGSVEAGFTITNTYHENKTAVNGEKVWDDANNQDGIRPDQIVLTLQAKLGNGSWEDVKDKTVTAATDWRFSFGDLDIQDNFGNYYSYRVIEKAANIPEGYRPTGEAVYTWSNGHQRLVGFVFKMGSDGTFTVINKHEPETITVSGSKIWRDNKNQYHARPNSIVIKLYANGKEIDSITVNAKNGSTWDWRFNKEYPKKENGVDIEYTVKEFYNGNEGVYGYAYSATQHNTKDDDLYFTMTNIIKKTTVKGNKTWTGYDNIPTDLIYSVIPDKIVVNLYKIEGNNRILMGSQVTNNWGWQFNDLPTFNVDGSRAEYIVCEEPAIAGWKSNGEKDEDASGADNNSNWITYNISNTFKPISITAKKVWSDGNSKHANESVSLSLWYSEDGGNNWKMLGNSVNNSWQAITVTLNAANNWEATIQNLPEYNKNGNKFLYKFQEDQVPNGYSVSYSNEGNIYTVTNTATTATATATIGASKQLNGSYSMEDGQFTFELLDSNKQTIIDEAENDQYGTVKFDAITYTTADTYIYYIREVEGTEPDIFYDDVEYRVEVEVSENQEGKLEKTVTYYKGDETDAVSNAIFSNSTKLSISVPVTKTVMDTDEVEQDFEFHVEPVESWTPIHATPEGKDVTITAEQLNAGGGTASATFPAFELKVTDIIGKGKNDALYMVTEKAVDPSTGYVYDDRVIFQWVDFVTENGIPVGFSTRTEYTYVSREDFDTAAAYVDNNKGKLYPEENFDVLRLNYIYRLLEGNYPAELAGIQDAFKYVWKEDGEPAGPEFTNIYVEDISENFQAKKVMAAGDLGQFTFQLKDENGTVLSQVTNDADGDVTFASQTYTLGDVGKTIKYTIGEKIPDGAVLQTSTGNYIHNSIEYDSTIYDVEVTISRGTDGQLEATVVYKKGDTVLGKDDVPTFTNNYHTTSVSVTKQWPAGDSGIDLTDSLKLYQRNSSGDTLVTDDQNMAKQPTPNGNVYTWSELPKYEQVNGQISEIIYVVKEEPSQSDQATLNGYNVTYTNVAPYKDKTDAVYNGGTIINAAAVSAKVEAIKKLNGAAPANEQFRFTLTDTNTPATTLTQSNDADGMIEFTVGPFTEIKTYYYTLAEVIPDAAKANNNKLNGYTYDPAIYHVEVVVSRDPQTQKLVPSVTYKTAEGTRLDAAPTFANRYEATGTLTVPFSKELVNKDFLPDDENHTFTFKMEAAQGSPASGYTIAENGEKKITFNKNSSGRQDAGFALSFTAANTYVFTVTETDSCCAAIQKDPTVVYTVKIKVVDNKNGQLDAAIESITKGAETVQEMLFVNTYQVTDISVKKVWDDNNTDHSNDSIQVQLYNGTTAVGDPVVLNKKDKGWEYSWSNLPMYAVDADGNATLIDYNVDELSVPDGYVKNVVEEGAKTTITNTLIKGATGKLTINKTVQNIGTGTATSTDQFSFKVERTSAPEGAGTFEDVTANLSDKGSQEVNLSFPVAGTYVYKVHEIIPADDEKLPGYTYDDAVYTVTFVVTPDNAQLKAGTPTWTKTKDGQTTTSVTSADFVNKYGAVSAQLTATKVLQGEGIQLAAEQFSFELKDPNGEVEVLQTKSNAADGTVTFDAIEYKADGEYKYTISEKDETVPEGYVYDKTVHHVTVNVATVNGKMEATVDYAPTDDDTLGSAPVFTNKYGMTQIEVTKIWDDANNQDGKRPESITIRLWNGTEEVRSATLSATGEGDAKTWPTEVTFDKLPMYDSDGQVITYTVTEDKVTDYSTQVNNATYTITNTYAPGMTSVSVEKVWSDSDNVDGLRPGEITVNLLAGGKVEDSVVLDEDNNWKHTFENLAAKNAGQDIVYTVEEVTKDGEGNDLPWVKEYSGKIEENAAKTGYIITNTHEATKISIKVTKTWVDDDNKLNKRPDSIAITLLADGNPVGDSVTLTKANADANDANTWTYEFTGLPLNKTGSVASPITYTITEAAVEHYDTAITGDASKGFAVTNTCTYAADGKLHLEGIKKLTGDVQAVPEKTFAFGIYKGDVKVADGYNTADGKIVFDTVQYTQNDIGATYLYTVKEIPGPASDATYNYTYDETVYSVSVNVTDDGEGGLVVNKSITKNSQPASIEFTNAIVNKVGHIGVLKVDKKDTAKGLPDAVFGVYSEADCNKESWKGDIRTGETGAGSLMNLPIGTYYVQESVAPKGYLLDNTIYTVVVVEGETAMVNGVHVTNTKLGRLMLEKSDRLNPDKKLPGAVYTLYNDEACLPEDKVADITTGDNGIGSLEGVPAGTYWVKETKAPEGYEVDPLPYKVVVAEDADPDQPVFVQVSDFPLRGALTISKTVVGVDETTESFLFDIELSITTADPIVGSYEATLNGLETAKVTFAATEKGAKATVSLKSGETLVIRGLRDGVTYTVTEQPNSRYDVQVNGAKAAMATGTIKENAVSTVAFQNTLKLTSFSVKKEWAGLAESEKAPAIQLTLYCNGTIVTKETPKPDAKGWYVYNDLPATVEGKAAVYTVKEDPLSGYTTTYLNKGEHAAVTDCAHNGSTIVNSKIPQTGDGKPLALWMTTMLLAALGLVGLKAYSRKREN